MASKVTMRRVTILMPEQVAADAEQLASSMNLSLSQFISTMVEIGVQEDAWLLKIIAPARRLVVSWRSRREAKAAKGAAHA